MTGFTIGCDPEIFLKEKGKPVSAYGIIEGTKKAPFKTERGAYQVDGMAVEFNTDPVPSNDFDAFNLNVVHTIRAMKAAVGEGRTFAVQPVMEFTKDYLDSQPDEAKELGCDPDFSAYTLKHNPTPDGTRLFRTGAGHLHFGWGADIPVDNEEHIAICADFVKTLDCTVGLFMTFIDRDARRRDLYGKAGAFRPKPYGVEYRTPSNVWIKNKDRRKCIHALMGTAITMQKAGGSDRARRNLVNYYQVGEKEIPTQDEIVRIINEGDWQKAEEYLDRLFQAGCWVGSSWPKVKVEMAKVATATEE